MVTRDETEGFVSEPLQRGRKPRQEMKTKERNVGRDTKPARAPTRASDNNAPSVRAPDDWYDEYRADVATGEGMPEAPERQ
jgi:hypothetical protein